MEIMNFNKKVRPGNLEKKQQNINTFESLYDLFEGRKRVLDFLKSKIFSLAPTEGTGRS